MGKSYRYCLFDLDGTLIDSSLGITNSVIYALKKFGIQESDRTALYRFIGPPLTDSFREFYGFSEEMCQDAVRYYREYYKQKGIYENQVYEGMEDLLAKIRERNREMIVATSKPEVFAREIIRYFHLAPYFSYVAGMELDGRRGTKAEVIDYALRESGIVCKSEVLMIGDRRHDVEGAHQARIDCLGVLYGFGSREELEKAGADEIAVSVSDILRYI